MSKLITEIRGFDQLKSAITKLADDKDKKTELRLVLRQVAKPTLQAAKILAPKSKRPHMVSGKRTKKIIQPGSLSKSIGFIDGKQQNPTVYVGPRAKGSNNGFYGHFVEYGHNLYRVGFKRKRSASADNSAGVTSRTKAQPFMAQAYAQTGGLVTEDAVKRVANFIQRRIDKLSA